MSDIANVDKLNIIYFGEMEIPADEKKRRIAFAKTFERILRKYYDTIQDLLKFSSGANAAAVPLSAAAAALAAEYRALIESYYPEVADEAAGWVNAHSRQFAVQVTQTRISSENPATIGDILTAIRTEINSVGNLALLLAASNEGKRRKRWKTFGDSKVRPSHRNAGGQTVPIDQPFIIGGYRMMFPGDSSLGAPASEIVNCRCSVEYI